jgi:hypothetical protein
MARQSVAAVVTTGLGKNRHGGSSPIQRAHDSVAGMRREIEQLNPEKSGRFSDLEGCSASLVTECPQRARALGRGSWFGHCAKTKSAVAHSDGEPSFPVTGPGQRRYPTPSASPALLSKGKTLLPCGKISRECEQQANGKRAREEVR